MTFPVLAATAVSGLRYDRFAVGSAVNQTARQVGGALGVAVLVAILGTATTASASLAAFRHLWIYCVFMALLAGGVCTLLRSQPRHAVQPTSAAGEAVAQPRLASVAE
jgi:hypothetical protein